MAVSDEVAYFQAAQRKMQPSAAASTGEVETILVTKICSALKTMNYGESEVERVRKLVKKNEVLGNVVGPAATADGLPATVETTLRSMLDGDNQNHPAIYVNSNEPVLLVNSLGSLSPSALRSVTDEVLKQLHDTWNIWPVRIYAGTYTQTQEDGSVSVSVLNVVNTDIGGPSMIQLLDAQCGYQAWNEFARKEAWNGREFLSKEDQDPTPSMEDVMTSPPIQLPIPSSVFERPEAIQPTDLTIDATHEQKSNVGEQDVHEEEVRKSEDDLVLVSLVGPLAENPKEQPVSEDEHSENDHSAPSFVIAELPELPDILHPTWEHHEGGETLLDMVKRQAQRLGISSPQKAEHEATETGPKDAENTQEKNGAVAERAAGTPSPEAVAEGSEEFSDDDFEAI